MTSNFVSKFKLLNSIYPMQVAHFYFFLSQLLFFKEKLLMEKKIKYRRACSAVKLYTVERKLFLENNKIRFMRTNRFFLRPLTPES